MDNSSMHPPDHVEELIGGVGDANGWDGDTHAVHGEDDGVGQQVGYGPKGEGVQHGHREDYDNSVQSFDNVGHQH